MYITRSHFSPLASPNLRSNLTSSRKAFQLASNLSQKRFASGGQQFPKIKNRLYTHTKSRYQNSDLLKSLAGCAIGVICTLIAEQYLRGKQTEQQELNVENGPQSVPLTSYTAPFDTTLQSCKIPSGEEDGLFKATIPDKDLFALGGYTEVLDNLADLVRYLQDPHAFTKSGAKVPKGVILSGPPGVGKTFLAEAVAGHAGVPFILVSGSDFSHQYIGVAETRIRELFQIAEKQAPCVLCLDEIDSIASKRLNLSGQPSSAATNNNKIVNQLLALLSQEHPGVIVIATTNIYENLDAAIVRPGRFDRHLALSLPNQKERKKIMEIHLKNKKLHPNVSLDDLSFISTGFSGAKLAAWINEAAISAHKEQCKEINTKHFEAARTLIEEGLVTRTATDLVEKKRTALHESGHAVVGHMLNLRVYKISVRPSSNSSGRVEWISPEDSVYPTKQELLDRICMGLAGRAAESLSGVIVAGSASDIAKAKELATIMVLREGMGSSLIGSPLDVERILESEMRRAEKILKENQSIWLHLTDNLMQHDELLREDFLKVMSGTSPLKESSSWFSRESSSTAQTTTSPLPPKSKPRTHKLANQSTNLPFTQDEIAQALKIQSSSIRSITRDGGGFNIRLKPSFLNHNHMDKMVKELKANDVECTYYSLTLSIYADGATDFINFIKRDLYRPYWPEFDDLDRPRRP